MSQEILSIAIYQPYPDMESASLTTMRALFATLSAKGYSRDILYKDKDSLYVLLRYWKSEEARRSAQEDPDIQRHWSRLGNEIQIVKVYETLTEVSRENIK